MRKQTQIDYHEFSAQIEVVREKALLLNNFEQDPFWMPRSQILIDGEKCMSTEFWEGQVVTVSAPAWLMRYKNLIEDPRTFEATPGNRP